MRERDLRLLKEFIEQGLINELGDTYGAIQADSGDLMNLMGMGKGSNVFKTIAGSIANVGSHALSLLKTFVVGLPTLIVPFVTVNWKNITKDERRRQAVIEKMYPDIFTKLRGNGYTDEDLMAFMFSPAIASGAFVGKLGADAAFDFFDALSGKNPRVAQVINVARKKKPVRRFAPTESVSLRVALLEFQETNDQQQQSQQQGATNVNAVYQQIKEELMRSKPVIDIQNAAFDIKNTTWKNMIQLSKNVAAAQSIKALQGMGLNVKNNIANFAPKTNADANALNNTLQAVKTKIVDQIIVTVGNDCNIIKEKIAEDSDAVAKLEKGRDAAITAIKANKSGNTSTGAQRRGPATTPPPAPSTEQSSNQAS